MFCRNLLGVIRFPVNNLPDFKNFDYICGRITKCNALAALNDLP